MDYIVLGSEKQPLPFLKEFIDKYQQTENSDCGEECCCEEESDCGEECCCEERSESEESCECCCCTQSLCCSYDDSITDITKMLCTKIYNKYVQVPCEMSFWRGVYVGMVGLLFLQSFFK